MKLDLREFYKLPAMMKNRKYVWGILALTILTSGLVRSVYGEKHGSLAMPMATPHRTVVVTSTSDSGSGTLRQALLEAQSSDIITFDSAVFPPGAPATIYLASSLPPVTHGDLTIDGSNAGVVLDGSAITDERVNGLEITSDGNIIRGLQIISFPFAAVSLQEGAQNNIIGGDREVGAGPLGQGNLLSGNGRAGVGIWNTDTSHNTIMGNYIGTDISGLNPLANLDSGVLIDSGAHDNMVGPDNIIAQNGIGIQIVSNSAGNTITQNSIHDNRGPGIALMAGGNTDLAAPLILDFDLAAGTLTGTTCVNCVIEIFSDDSNEGETYEGSTISDSHGLFSFNKGASFKGPHLTATATDADGNTSPFSAPTRGTSRSTNLQEGNNLPKTQLQPKKTRELEDNRIGDDRPFNMKPFDGRFNPKPEDFLDYINNVGHKWIYTTINWPEWTPDTTYSRYYIDPTHDEVITGLTELGIEIVYSLAFWDEEIQPQEGYTRFKKEDEIQRYLDYVQFIVHNFRDRIQYYEMISEPRFWEGPDAPFNQQNIEPADYIELVRRTVAVIRHEYPEAKIVVGATVLFYEGYYLFEILESDIMPLVDGVSWHPFYGQSPEYESEYYYNYSSIVQEIKDVASAHGFAGEYIAGGIGWGTALNPPGEPYLPTYSETVAAKYFARGIIMHLGMDVIVGLGGLSNDLQLPKMIVVRNLATIMAGAEPVSLPIEIQSEATDIRSYSFSLPNNDTLIALWTDGVAADEDPGVKADIRVSGFTDWNMMGVDVLNGFQQSMIASSESGDMVIQNLIVRDYPLILRLAPAPEPTLMSISLLATTINRGESIIVSGSISPAIPGATVHLTYTKAGEAEVERTVTTAPDGSFSDTYTPDAVGSWSVEASWAGDRDHEGATSPGVFFTVEEVKITTVTETLTEMVETTITETVTRTRTTIKTPATETIAETITQTTTETVRTMDITTVAGTSTLTLIIGVIVGRLVASGKRSGKHEKE